MQDNRFKKLIYYCNEPRTRNDMQEFIGITNRGYFRKNILNPLLEQGVLKPTIPEKPTGRNQKYLKVENSNSK